MGWKRRELTQLLGQQHGVVRHGQRPELDGALRAMARSGDLVRMHPGVYALTACRAEPRTRIQAATLWRPRAILTGGAAASLSFWSSAPCQTIDLVVPGKTTPAPAGIHQWRFAIPASARRVAEGLNITSPAWTAVWLAAWDDGQAIEEALRARAMSVSQMNAVAEQMKGLWGISTRRFVVANSQNCPWSAAERKLHQILRAGNIDGWHGNWAIRLDGEDFVLDAAMPQIKFAIEVNGYEFHRSRESFVRDHEKVARLQEHGWTVLSVTWLMMEHPGQLIRRVRRLMDIAEHVCRLTH